jgi:hypothetical protein
MADQPSSDPDDAFFEALAGRQSGGSGADALRVALLEEARTVEEASTTPFVQPTQAQLALRARIKAKLVADGTLPAGQAAPDAAASTAPKELRWPREADRTPTPMTRPAAEGVISRLVAWLSTWSMPQMAGLAASMLLGTVLVLNLGKMDDGSDRGDVMRGGKNLSISVADPGATAASLASGVQALGGEATVVQINDKQWDLSVAVDKPESNASVRAFLREKGFPVGDLPPYELSVFSSK